MPTVGQIKAELGEVVRPERAAGRKKKGSEK